MPVPKRKVSRTRRDKRSANKGIKPKAITTCQTCQAPQMPHQICKECGYYKGKKVLRTKTDRMYLRGQAREAKAEKVKARGPEAAAGAAETQGASEKE